MLMAKRPVAQFVMKISKYCNLRCTYCYEFNELGNKQRMSPELISRIFENIASHVVPNEYEWVSFVWHGGEPFLIPLEYYESIGRLQQEIFGEKVAVWNVVQTNLTVMTPRHLEFLKSQKFFRAIGISFDVLGDQRVDTQGRRKDDVVLENMQKLIDHEIPFGAIAVLARNTLPHVKPIYQFYDQLQIGSRFLPFYMDASNDQIARHAVTYDEQVDALKTIFGEWLASDNATPVDPIGDYVDYAIAHISKRPAKHYRREADEFVFMVGLDGSVWGQGEAYEPEYQYGNLAQDGFGQILSSQGRRRSVEEAQSRTERLCRQCPYYGACPGFFVADSSPQQKRMFEESGCPVRDVVGHIVRTLETTGVAERITSRAAILEKNPSTQLVPF
ncbi:MAG: uncharacterized protein QOJ99_429 [Bryobacterales bacterium]|nr:uncharacterized protein [Bryobacterales bacterium]